MSFRATSLILPPKKFLSSVFLPLLECAKETRLALNFIVSQMPKRPYKGGYPKFDLMLVCVSEYAIVFKVDAQCFLALHSQDDSFIYDLAASLDPLEGIAQGLGRCGDIIEEADSA